jgi:phosphate transport system substrate-binding protein
MTRFRNLMTAAMAASVLLALAACGGGETPVTDAAAPSTQAADSRPLTIKGSDTMVILGQRFAEEYMKAHPGTVVQVNGGGSGTGIAALINGTVDLAQASRAMKDEEKAQVRKNRNADVVETPVALDSLAVFVHGSSPVQSLTIDQVKQIFQGRITNWKDVGGPEGNIILYGRENSSGTYDYFREHVLAGEDFAPRVQTLQGTAAIINAVARDPRGIGYGGIAYAKEVRAIAVGDGNAAPVAPSVESVAAGTYPLARNLYFYHLEGAPERVTNFVEFALSPQAQEIVSLVGYFPLPKAPAQAGTEASAGSPSSDGTP